MKTLPLAFILFSVIVILAQNTSVAVPMIEVQPAVIHLGKIVDTQITYFSFTITNHSQQNVKVDRLQTSCGCTVAEQNFQDIAPGTSSELKIKFDPNGRRGYARWEILIYTTLPQAPVVMGAFDVEILREGMLSHEAVFMGEFQRGTDVSQKIWISPQEYPNFSVKNVEVVIPGLANSFDVKLERTEYDGFYPGKRPAYMIEFFPKKDIPYGRHEGMAVITTDIPGKEKIELPFLAKVAGIIGVRPDYLSMGNLTNSDNFSRKVLIYHREGGSFQITKSEVDVPFLTCGVIAIIEDQYFQLIISKKKDAEFPLGEFRGNITVSTTNPEMPQVIIPLQGIIIEKK